MNAPDHTGRWLAWFKSERVFVILALVFGTSLVFLTAPFQAPDEDSHFLRAYQVSLGQFIPQQRNGWPGGELPQSIISIPSRFEAIQRHPQVKTSAGQIKDALAIPLRPQDHVFIWISHSVYAPTGYLPQALGICIGRWLDAPPLALMYMGRLFNLLAWTAIGYASLRIIPFGRCAIMLLLLMPMSLFLAASLSADAMTDALAVLVVAMVCRYALASGEGGSFRRAAVGAWPLIVLTAASIALTMGKIAYLPLAGLIFVIPADRLGGRRRYAVITGATCLANVAALAWWISRTPGLNTPMPPHVDARAQLALFLHHPIQWVRLPLATWYVRGRFLFESYVGTLGWLDTKLPTVLNRGYLTALVIASLPGDDDAPPPRFGRVMAVAPLAIVGSIYLVTVIEYLTWTPVLASLVEGLQGRYYIPVTPAILLVIHTLLARVIPPAWTKRTPSYYRRIVFAIFALICCLMTVVIVYRRYYVA